MRSMWQVGIGVPSPPSYHPGEHAMVYGAHGPYEIDPLAVTALHGLMATVFKPSVTDEPGVIKQVGEWLAADLPVVSVMNHQHYIDHFVDAATTYQTPELRLISERNSPLGKVEYLDTSGDPTELAHIISYLYRVLDTTPVYRPQDLEHMLPDQPTDNLLKQTDAAMTQMLVERLLRGKGFHAYTEGTRNLGDWLTICRTLGGVARILAEADRHKIAVGLLIGGRSYGVTHHDDRAHINWRHPHVHFQTFYTGSFARKNATTQLIASDQQAAVTTANMHMLQRAPDLRLAA